MKQRRNPLSYLGWLGFLGILGILSGAATMLAFFLFFFFLVGKLRMGSRSWVNDQRFHVGDIGEQ